MNLHGQIMNLQCKPANMDAEPNQKLAYKVGHRDARHAAAELALKADAEIERLRKALQEADTLMGHDDAMTEWRERWAGLWGAA